MQVRGQQHDHLKLTSTIHVVCLLRWVSAVARCAEMETWKFACEVQGPTQSLVPSFMSTGCLGWGTGWPKNRCFRPMADRLLQQGTAIAVPMIKAQSCSNKSPPRHPAPNLLHVAVATCQVVSERPCRQVVQSNVVTWGGAIEIVRPSVCLSVTSAYCGQTACAI